MEYNIVPASQIMPVSGFELPTPLTKIKKEAEDFFFSKGQLAYKIFKNAYAQAQGESKNKEAFVSDFFDILEESIRLQMKETGVPMTPVIKDAFEIIKNSFKVLNHTNNQIEPITFYTAIVAYVLSKLR